MRNGERFRDLPQRARDAKVRAFWGVQSRVAKACGVSVATVYRIVHATGEQVAAATREAVLAALDREFRGRL